MEQVTAPAQLQELLRKLGFDAEIVERTNEDGRSVLEISSPHHALLIGKQGETLRALQLIFNTIQQRSGSDYVTLDIAGYRKEREEKLHSIALEAAEKARTTKTRVHLKPMNAYERRQVHMVLADMADIVTSSEGIEPRRVIVVQLRGE